MQTQNVENKLLHATVTACGHKSSKHNASFRRKMFPSQYSSILHHQAVYLATYFTHNESKCCHIIRDSIPMLTEAFTFSRNVIQGFHSDGEQSVLATSRAYQILNVLSNCNDLQHHIYSS